MVISSFLIELLWMSSSTRPMVVNIPFTCTVTPFGFSAHLRLSGNGISTRWSIHVTSHRPCFCICTCLGATIRFVADNRGVWFFDCHIEWHMSTELAIAFLVSSEQLLTNVETVSLGQKTTVRSIETSNLFFLNQSVVLSFPSITASVCCTRVIARRELTICSLLIEGQLQFLLLFFYLSVVHSSNIICRWLTGQYCFPFSPHAPGHDEWTLTLDERWSILRAQCSE